MSSIILGSIPVTHLCLIVTFLVDPGGKEYEVVASTAAAEDCGSGGGVAVKHGMVGKGPVVGMVQVSSINKQK